MIKIISTLFAAGFILTAGYSYSRAEDAPQCPVASKADAHEQASKIPNVKIIQLTDEQMKTLFEAKGNPPNAEDGVPLEAELVDNGEIAGINIYQKGCFINRLGPSYRQMIYRLLGMEVL